MGSIGDYDCGNPGPGDKHCTDFPGHRFSCQDANAGGSFNDRQNFRHDCNDESCSRQHFDNEGD